VLLNIFQFAGYVSPFPRLAVVAIPNEMTAIAQTRTFLRALGISTEGYVFSSEFSWRGRSWIVNVSPSNNVLETIHTLEFRAMSGWNVREDINWDLIQGKE
jgi:hypothetical protein